jgi:hypothetical protein
MAFRRTGSWEKTPLKHFARMSQYFCKSKTWLVCQIRLPEADKVATKRAFAEEVIQSINIVTWMVEAVLRGSG